MSKFEVMVKHERHGWISHKRYLTFHAAKAAQFKLWPMEAKVVEREEPTVDAREVERDSRMNVLGVVISLAVLSAAAVAAFVWFGWTE